MKKILSILVAVMLVIGLVACSNSGSAGNSANDSGKASTTPDKSTATTQENAAAAPKSDYLSNKPLRVATMPAQMGVYINYAMESDLFKKAGINVEMIMFAGGAPINEAFGAGQIDGALGGLANVHALANDMAVLLAEVDSVGADGIVARNDSDIVAVKGKVNGKPDMYGSAETLKGKSFICQVGQAQQFYISKYISQFGLTDDDISFINMADAAAYQAFIAGQGDVIATKMPYIYDLITKDNCTIISNIADATDIEIKDPVIFTPEIIKSRRDEVVIFLKVIYGVIDQMEKSPELRKEAITKFYQANGKNPEAKYLDYELNMNKLIGVKRMTESDYYVGDGMQAVADFYGTTGAIAKEKVGNVSKNIDTSLLSEALGIQVKAYKK
jgi:ABC-type nitrate/sulfonate/bicarbonate transport system substrate-binding protein